MDRIVRRNQEEVLLAAKTLPGFKGFYVVMDRDAGKAATLLCGGTKRPSVLA